ncbi:PAS domain-containing sensor histidine kinase [Halobellus ordinarius]|uniref:PAS domain-containing sensor histidine kinase n=1 Tax=Halobellus ordinarius TaxID=3075120 RepID=UPI00288010CE|nr:PAS domain-containing sensor histidine kinase [Halobellus sp. ZY16]
MSSHDGAELPAEYDSLHTGIALYHPNEGTILDANERFERILGYTSERLRDLSVAAYTANTHPYSQSEFHRRLRASGAGEPQEFTWRIKRADGELIWVQIHLAGHRSPGENTIRAELRDITDYYETYHREELFWRILRHNLRNEAAIISGYADQITAADGARSMEDAITTLQTRGEKLGSIAESVKEIERAVANTETQHVRRNATAAVREVVAEVEHNYPAANVAVTEREEMWIDIDDAFAHAIRHAVENAIIHSEENAPTVSLRIGPSPNTGRVEICIRDANPHIPDEELAALSTPTEITSTSHGSGIGLFVMKWCVESLGGEITFERRTPQGNAVYLYFPPKDPRR